MAAVLHYYDHTPGQRRAAPTGRMLRLATERVTLRNIISRRIETEVATYNSGEPSLFDGLVQPSDSERELNGYRLRNRRRLDAEEQTRVACEAFERRGFIVLFDERQVEKLDEELVLTGDNRLAFLRLMPLVGG
jgi:hypothetical protein